MAFQAIGFAAMAALGNALFAYSQRSQSVADNPFLSVFCATFFCSLLLLVAVAVSYTGTELSWLRVNGKIAMLAGAGFAVTFIGFYFMYRFGGASIYTVYAVFSMMTTSVGVGIIVLREPCNVWHLLSVGTAILAIVLFSIGQYRLS